VQLAGDGSWYLIALMRRPLPFGWYFARRFAHVIAQLPTVMAIRAGVTNVAVLARILGVGFMLPSVVSLLLCARIGRERPDVTLFALLSFAAVTSSVSFFMVTESHILVALFWPLVVLFALRRDWTPGMWILAAVLAVPTLRSYESMLLMGPVLAGLAAWRGLSSTNRSTRIAFIAFAVYFALGVAIAAWYTIHPQIPENLASFINAWSFFRDGTGHLHLLGILSLVAISLIVTSVFVPEVVTGGRYCIAIACVAAALSPIVSSISIAPILNARARVLNAYIPPLLALVAIYVVKHPLSRAQMRFSYSVIAVLAVSQLVWNSLAAREWVNYLDVFGAEMSHREGLVPYGQSILSHAEVNGRPIAVMNRSWTMPMMSILMSPRGNVQAIIVDWQDNDFKPLDPFHPESLPNLSRYGIRYDRYAAALRR